MSNGTLSIKQHLESDQFRETIRKVLPKHVTAERMARVAITALTRTPMLAQCEQASFFRALLDLSQWGLEPDGRRAHLIPFRNNKRQVVECQLIIDYKGIVELVMRGGNVSKIHADIVCENDEFEFDRGEITKHKINFREPRGNVYAVYAMITMRDGTTKCEVMSREEVEGIRSRSKAKDSGPWKSDWSEMAKKTVFRRVSKWVPLSADVRDAIDADDRQFENIVDGVVSKRPTIEDLTDRLIESDPELDSNEQTDLEPQGDTIQQDETQQEHDSKDDSNPPRSAIEIAKAFNEAAESCEQILDVTTAWDKARREAAQIEDEAKLADLLTELERIATARKDAIRSKRGK